MLAFRDAVERWEADMLEMDVRLTGDGEVVVLHDPTVDRTTDGSGPVAAMAWSEVRRLDAAYHFAGPEGDVPHRGRDVGIPRFADVLSAFPRVRITAEVKEAAAAGPLVQQIRAHAAEHRVLVAAARESRRREARGYPGAWGASSEQIRRFLAVHDTPLGVLYTPRCDALQVPPTWKGREIITPSFVREAHRRNIPVHAWTVDDASEIRRLLEMGVDSIQSDRPDVLARVLVEDFGRPPPPGLRPRGPGGRARPPRPSGEPDDPAASTGGSGDRGP